MHEDRYGERSCRLFGVVFSRLVGFHSFLGLWMRLICASTWQELRLRETGRDALTTVNSEDLL